MTYQEFKLAQSALDAQFDPSLFTTVSSFHHAMSVLYGWARDMPESLEWINNHPVAIAFAYRIANTTGILRRSKADMNKVGQALATMTEDVAEYVRERKTHETFAEVVAKHVRERKNHAP